MIIHCDLKPSNILLTQDMKARVGDFGIARILNEAARETRVNSNSTIGVRGSIGSVAPGNSICIYPVYFTARSDSTGYTKLFIPQTVSINLLQNMEKGLKYQLTVMFTALASF
jgi:serine/threonine protein kinase